MVLAGQAKSADVRQSVLGQEQYLTPQREILDAVLAPWYKNVSITNISPDGTRCAILERDGLVSIQRLAKPHVNLGGIDIDIKASRARTYTTRSGVGLTLMNLSTKKTVLVNSPEDARISDPKWSPDSSQIAFLVHTDDATRLYVADAESGKCKPASRRPLLATQASFDWTDQGKRIAAVFVTEPRAPMPLKPLIDTTPRIQNSDEKRKNLSTYPSLLKSPYDQALLEYFTNGQLGLLDPATSELQSIGTPQMYQSLDAAPNGGAIRVRITEKPFSYLVPTSMYGNRDVIMDLSGKEVAVIKKTPLRLGEPDPEKPSDTDKRAIIWRPRSSSLMFLQQGPADKDKKRKDRLMSWNAPYGEKDTTVVYEADQRINTARYGSNGNTLFITQTVEGKERLSAIRLKPTPKAFTLQEIKADDDERAEPIADTNGTIRVSQDGKSTYLAGTHLYKDPLKEAPRPFVDRVDIETGKRTRIFESSPDIFEQLVMLDNDGTKSLVTRQTTAKVPQTYLRDFSTKEETRLTNNKDYAPDLTQARRETIVVTRPDGFKFQVKITLPRFSYKNPAFFWFYPGEFTSQEEYDKSKKTFNKNLFPAISANNKQIFIRMGYAVVEPDCPIVGPKGHMNDSYVPQLRNNLNAVIDELERRDYIDRTRLAIGGHSYGAFSTANALIHTPYFKAGIAGDGCYLRPLTPFGFQNEERKLWEGRETYLSMSPLLYAEQMTGALLLYHGLEDQNVGTSPINSERMYTALESLGKNASLVMYPYEDHGQIAKETVLDQWARFAAWLDKWLRPTAPIK